MRGLLARAKFKKLGAACRARIDAMVGVKRSRLNRDYRAKLRIDGSEWKSAVGYISLAFNPEASPRHKPRPKYEFLRLKMQPKEPRGHTIERKIQLRSSVTRKNGDVWISTVPMVDQGAKGYCVVAACQRIFEYFKLPVDQHQLAPLTGTGADSGTHVDTMEAALEKIVGALHSEYVTLMKREPRELPPARADTSDVEQFRTLVMVQTDNGIPILWSRVTGVFKEDNTPRAGTVAVDSDYGHHMSLIIGFDKENDQVIYSDTWGLGHGRKEASIVEAAALTTGLYLFKPAM